MDKFTDSVVTTAIAGSIRPYASRLHLPEPNSHKGQNGKLLIVGGSQLFHSASIWAAEIASHFVDMVHYASTEENNQILLSLKKKFINGMVVSRQELDLYVDEDDSVLIGPGMMRSSRRFFLKAAASLNSILRLKDEGELTYRLTDYLLHRHPNKQWVIDAGALQMMDKNWLLDLSRPAIITPHQQEFTRLFGVELSENKDKKKNQLRQIAGRYRSLILLKTGVSDFVSDGRIVIEIRGGNAGLTKGGSGDVLAGLTAAFSTRNPPLVAAVTASYCLKKAADVLFQKNKYWYNIDNLIDIIPTLVAKSGV
ncbi:NAD(P)H-hydrate dehydratase [Patescibacteria group bacterium]|nr:NAD(P)H-hydrate dehydratase [Patescibacteria group bacterium]MCL5091746.1 NAD(P)H-hydrate dehydratase [Patescibacteria group bacterium]